MKKVIFMPDAEQIAELQENSYKEFKAKAEKDGWVFGEKSGAFIRELFAVGWAYGWNGCYDIIRGQMETDYIMNELLNRQDNE